MTVAKVITPFGSDLTEDDYREMAARWITGELADAAGLKRVDSYTGRQMFARKTGARSISSSADEFRPGIARSGCSSPLHRQTQTTCSPQRPRLKRDISTLP
jgi:hypothetical protein